MWWHRAGSAFYVTVGPGPANCHRKGGLAEPSTRGGPSSHPVVPAILFNQWPTLVYANSESESLSLSGLKCHSSCRDGGGGTGGTPSMRFGTAEYKFYLANLACCKHASPPPKPEPEDEALPAALQTAEASAENPRDDRISINGPYEPSGHPAKGQKDLAMAAGRTNCLQWDLRARACRTGPEDLVFTLALPTTSSSLMAGIPSPAVSGQANPGIFAGSNIYSEDAYPHVSRLQNICDKSVAHAPQPLALDPLSPGQPMPNLPPSGLNTPACTYSGSTPSTTSAKTPAIGILSYPAIYGHDNDLVAAAVTMDHYEDIILGILNNYAAARRAHRKENSRDSHNRFESVKESVRDLAVEYRGWKEPRAQVAADYAFALMSALSVH
ncbi:hypothetical protein DFP72DRAFT_862830 [Ephemerocybe angulata]|uniref:Uncharacterized protein n=1 Tax=Ephemerocybe angulata TaxID=980116 RepID=A0A8H6LRN6_9AGAR|nr:hypothetical protein DFP72DRAFT_862830 [Tulosesus angulatus]